MRKHVAIAIQILGIILLAISAIAWIHTAARPLLSHRAGARSGFDAPTPIGGKYYGTIIRFVPPDPIDGETLMNYNVYRVEAPICSGLEIVAKVRNKNPSEVVWYDFTAFDANAVYWYTISAVDTNGVESPQSTCIKVQIPAGD